MKSKRRIHDGIAGTLITLGVVLGYYVNPTWFWLSGILGITLVQSAFTGFCPVYFVLDRMPALNPDTGSKQVEQQ